MRPISQTNLTKHMAKNKQSPSLIYGSVTYDLHYKCLFRIHLSILWLVFSIQRLMFFQAALMKIIISLPFLSLFCHVRETR